MKFKYNGKNYVSKPSNNCDLCAFRKDDCSDLINRNVIPRCSFLKKIRENMLVIVVNVFVEQKKNLGKHNRKYKKQ